MDIQYKLFGLQMRDPWKIANRPGEDGEGVAVTETVFVRLVDPKTGAEGLGEASPVPYYDESPETVIAFIKQLDPERLSFERYEESEAYVLGFCAENMAAKCAVCCALADGTAKLQGVSMRTFAGVTATDRPGFTSSYTIGMAEPEVIARKTRAAADYPILKLKVGLPEDFDNLAALRSASPASILRLDANEAWTTKEQALKQIERFAEDPKIEFIEQPMPKAISVEDDAWLKERSPMPIYADESYHTADDIERAVEGFHGVNVKLVKAGGPVAGARALEVANERGLKTMIGGMIESSWLVSAAAQISPLVGAIDLDGAALTTNDPFLGSRIPEGLLDLSALAGRPGVGAQLILDGFMDTGWHACGS